MVFTLQGKLRPSPGPRPGAIETTPGPLTSARPFGYGAIVMSGRMPADEGTET